MFFMLFFNFFRDDLDASDLIFYLGLGELRWCKSKWKHESRHEFHKLAQNVYSECVVNIQHTYT